MMRPVEPSGGVGVLPAMPVRDEDVSVGRGDHVAGLIEQAGFDAHSPRPPQGQQHLALGAELDDLVTLVHRTHRVGDPDVAVRVHVDTVRKDEESRTEAGKDLAGLTVKLEDRIDQGLRAPAGQSHAAAAVVGPDVPVDRVDVDPGRRAPFAFIGKIDPVGHHLGRRVGQVARRRIRNRSRIGWRRVLLFGALVSAAGDGQRCEKRQGRPCP